MLGKEHGVLVYRLLTTFLRFILSHSADPFALAWEVRSDCTRLISSVMSYSACVGVIRAMNGRFHSLDGWSVSEESIVL